MSQAQYNQFNNDTSQQNESIENIPSVNYPQQSQLPQQQQQQQFAVINDQQQQQIIQQQQQAHQMIQMPGLPVQNLSQQQFPQQFLYSVPKIPTSRFSQTVFCQTCNKPMETKVDYKVGPGSILIGALVAFCGFTYGCCLAPCFLDDCKDAIHKCNQCNTTIGKKKFLFDTK